MMSTQNVRADILCTRSFEHLVAAERTNFAGVRRLDVLVENTSTDKYPFTHHDFSPELTLDLC